MATELPPFQRLLDEHGTAVWRYLRARLGPQGADDAYQETVLTALRAYPSLRDATNLRGWLFTVASSRVVDSHRGEARRPVPVDRLPEEAGPEVEPDDRGVWAEVRILPDGQRDAIALRFAADLPYRDVAATLGCSEAAARQRVKAGLDALRARMEVRR